MSIKLFTILFFVILFKNYDNAQVDESLIVKIIGGKISNHLAFPWTTSLSVDGLMRNDSFRLKMPEKYKIQSHYCGGVILNSRWVLTAAHCILADEKMSVGYGNDLLKIFDEGRIRIRRAIAHPNFRNEDFSNDIGLLELSEPISFNHLVRPGCISTTYESHFGDQLIITGFGLTDHLRINRRTEMYLDGKNSRFLKEALIRDLAFTTEQCQKEPEKLCASYVAKEEFSSSCRGDSGSAIMSFKNEKMYVVGVTSSSNAYNISPDNPDILEYCTGISYYQRIAPYLNFIESYIGKDYCSDALN